METNVQLTPHDNLSSFTPVIRGKPFTGMGVIGVGSQVFSQRLGVGWKLHQAVDDIGLGPCVDTRPAPEVVSKLAHLGYHVASYLQVPDARVPQAFWTHMEQTGSQAGKCHRVRGALLEADDLRHHRHSWLFDPAISGGDLLIDTGGHLLSILYGLGVQDLQVTEVRWDTVLAEKPKVQIGGQQRQPATYFELDIEVSGGLFATAARGRLTVGKAVPRAGKYLQFECDKGCIDLTFPNGLTLRDVRGRPIPFTPSAAFAPQPYVNVLRRFLGQVQVGGAPETTFDIALACVPFLRRMPCVAARIFMHAYTATQRRLACHHTHGGSGHASPVRISPEYSSEGGFRNDRATHRSGVCVSVFGLCED